MTKEQRTITHTATADFLTNPETRALLSPFMAREITMSEAAKELGLELNTLHRRVRQMLELGLLEVTREDVRDGHRVKLYRATSSEFIVPMEATTHVDFENFIGEGLKGTTDILSQSVTRAMEKEHPHWGFKIYVEEDYGLLQRAIPLDANKPIPP